MKQLACLVFLAGVATPCVAEHAVGHVTVTLPVAGDERALSLSVWYPATTVATDEIGGNAVFQGTSAAPDAAVAEGRFPLAVLSHGGLRSAADSGAWLSAELAKAGFVAVEVNGPRPARAADAVNEIWQRPADMRRALDQMLGDTGWQAKIDSTRVSAVGFALGGTAALALAGGGIDPQAYAGYCDDHPEAVDCNWYQAQDVRLGSVDAAALAALEGDPRVTSAVALAPEFMPAFSDGLASLETPALHIALGAEGDDAQAGAGTALRHVVIPDTVLFDAFSACTKAGPMILEEEGVDPALCGASVAARSAAHEKISHEVVDFLLTVSAPVK